VNETGLADVPANLLASAQQLLLAPADLDFEKVSRVLGSIHAHDVDFADFYFQHSSFESWSLEEGIVKAGTFNIDRGVGVRAVSGDKQAFAYSDDISLPALAEALKISKKAAGLGFEWPDIGGVLDKLQEEVRELAEARELGDQASVEYEVGDLLFTLTNLARFLKVDPEQALRKTNSRFRERFRHIEESVAESGGSVQETPLERLEELWQEAKRRSAHAPAGGQVNG